MARIDWDRYVPPAERRTALWLAGTIVLLASLNLGRRLFPLSDERWWLPQVAFAAVYAASLGILLLLARRRFSAPPAVVGVVLLNALAATALRALGAALSFVTRPLLAGSLIAESGGGLVRTFAGGVLPHLAVLLAALLALGVLWMRTVDGQAASAEDEGAWAPAWRRFLEATGLGGVARTDSRRLVVAFVAVPAAVGVCTHLLGVPLQVVQARLLPAAQHPEAPSWVLSVLLLGLELLALAAAFVVVWGAISRYRAPRSVWLSVFAGVLGAMVTGLAGMALALPVMLTGRGGRPLFEALAWIVPGVATTAVSVLVHLGVLLAAVRFATRGKDGDHDAPAGQSDAAEDERRAVT